MSNADTRLFGATSVSIGELENSLCLDAICACISSPTIVSHLEAEDNRLNWMILLRAGLILPHAPILIALIVTRISYTVNQMKIN